METKTQKQLRTILNHIDNNTGENLSVEQLAEAAGVSIPQLFRVFAAEFFLAPVKYTLKRRLFFAAKKLVVSDTKVVDIAFEFGFNSHDSFIRAFRRVYGVTPTKFRANALQYNTFYRNGLYCVAGLAIPTSLIQQAEDDKFMQKQPFHHVDIVTVPETILIGVEYPVGEGSYDVFYEAYDKIFRNAPNRKYPNSENATHGVPRRYSMNGQLFYFVGIEVTNLDSVPEGAKSLILPKQTCAVIGYEGGVDYNELCEYFRDVWLKQSDYKPDSQKISPFFSPLKAWENYYPIWEWYAPNKDSNMYEERIYMPVEIPDSLPTL